MQTVTLLIHVVINHFPKEEPIKSVEINY